MPRTLLYMYIVEYGLCEVMLQMYFLEEIKRNVKTHQSSNNDKSSLGCTILEDCIPLTTLFFDPNNC